MVTMKRRGEANIQTFSLPLSPHNGNSEDVEHTAKVCRGEWVGEVRGAL